MASSATPQANLALEASLSGIKKLFRTRIIDSFVEIRTRFTQAVYTDSAYDAIGISAGKFSETVFRFIEDELTGAHTPFSTQIKNFGDRCRDFEQTPRAKAPESLRILIPRCLSFIYTVRSKRGIGHVGGDVEANQADITVIVSGTTWIACELIRIYYGCSLEEAQGIVSTLNTRVIPQVWNVMGKKRVLNAELSAKDRVLILCYTTPSEAVFIEDLFDWVEYSNMSMFRSSVIRPLHKAKLIEHNKELDAILISPLGVQKVELSLLKLGA